MDDKKFIQFLQNSLAEIPNIRQFRDPENSKFVAWWNKVLAQLEAKSEVFYQRASQIEFLPAVTSNKGDEEFARAYQRGVDEAEALVLTIIDQFERQAELERQRLEAEREVPSAPQIEALSEPGVADEDNHAPFTRLQSQRLAADINLSRYDTQTQTHAMDLFQQLEQGVMGGSAVSKHLSWLADNAPDVLIAIIAKAANR